MRAHEPRAIGREREISRRLAAGRRYIDGRKRARGGVYGEDREAVVPPI